MRLDNCPWTMSRCPDVLMSICLDVPMFICPYVPTPSDNVPRSTTHPAETHPRRLTPRTRTPAAGLTLAATAAGPAAFQRERRDKRCAIAGCVGAVRGLGGLNCVLSLHGCIYIPMSPVADRDVAVFVCNTSSSLPYHTHTIPHNAICCRYLQNCCQNRP